MHETVKDAHWHEPKAGENAGFGAFKRPKLPYDRFMEDEGVPVYRGIGAARVQDLPMAPWKRLGGRGSYIQLYGTEGLWGLMGWRSPAQARLTSKGISTRRTCLCLKGPARPKSWRRG